MTERIANNIIVLITIIFLVTNKLLECRELP